MSMNQKNKPVRNDALAAYQSLLSMDNAVSKKLLVNKAGNGEKNKERRSLSRSPSRGSKRSLSGSPSRGNKCSPSRSPSQGNKRMSKSPLRDKKMQRKIDFSIPDRSFGDLYCKACDSHMNSEDMWEMHLQGKRHLKNTKSSAEELEAERKFDYIDEKPIAFSDIDDETSPIVGLQHVCEMQRLEQDPLYSCFLCSTTVPNSRLLIEHVIGLKHRMAYLKEHDPGRYDLILASNLKKGQIEPVVEECVAKHELDLGRGKMIVKKEKSRSTHTWGVTKPQKEYRDNYPAYRYEREDKDYSSYQRKHTPPHHLEKSNDRNYDGRERYGYNSSRVDDLYSEKKSITPRLKEQPYPIPGNSHHDEFRYYDRATTSSIPPNKCNDRNYNLNAKVENILQDVSESDFGDLREFLKEKKKTPSLDSNVPDEVLGIISALPTISFFQLVLFKLDNIKIEDEIEINFLDRVANKATKLAMNVKSKMLTPSLRRKFQESIAENKIEVDNDMKQPPEDLKNLFEMVNECKTLSSVRTPAPVVYPPTQNHSLGMQSNYGTPQTIQTIPAYSSLSSSALYSPFERKPEKPFVPPVQNSYVPPRTLPSYSSRYSTYPCPAPDLTLTQENASKQSTGISPFDQLEARAKTLFGHNQWNSNDKHHQV